MILDEQDLQEGKEFIVGKWQADYVVNAFSNDLSHIPATEFKSSDGRNFSSLCLEFFEDQGVVLSEETSGKEARGSWEQTSYGEYRLTFDEATDASYGQAALTITVHDGCPVIGVGFLAIGLKKIAEGKVTKPVDIGDMEMSEEDQQMKEIVGRYEIAQMMSFLNGEFKLFPKEAVLADLEKRKAAGEDVDEEIADAEKNFASIYEFTDDHRVICWMKLPAGISEEQIKEALEAGEIAGMKDGFFCMNRLEWKYVGGKYYYNTGEYREVFGKVQSSWDALEFDEKGLLPMSDGMMKLRKI